jgi:hypothetical protein
MLPTVGLAVRHRDNQLTLPTTHTIHRQRRTATISHQQSNTLTIPHIHIQVHLLPPTNDQLTYRLLLTSATAKARLPVGSLHLVNTSPTIKTDIHPS